MKILAIETSCDETAIGVVGFQKNYFKVLSNIVSSQVKIHAKWGGVVPTLAKREHQKNLVPVLKRALEEANLLKKIRNKRPKIQEKRFKKLKKILIREEQLYKKLEKFLESYQKPKINFLAVTTGPGLEPALWVGVNFAKALSYFWNFPVIPVNHIEGHIFANFIHRDFKVQDKSFFPILCLSVAGGHTQLILMEDYGKYKLLGETRDDTVGECFDKVARMLNLGYPGGPIIAKLAQSGNSQAFNFPRPMIHSKDYDFSFSGLKTALLYFLKKQNKKMIKQRKNDICASFQQAAIDVLIKKTIKAAKIFRAKTIILAGGVAANIELRKQLDEEIKNKLSSLQYFSPDLSLCTDNAVMIAITSHFHWSKGKSKNWREIKANANLKI